MAPSVSPQKYYVLGVFCLALMFLPACDPMTATMGAGAALTGAAAEERGVSGVYEDTKIRTRINYRWLRQASILMDRLAISVQNGHVLLTGVVETEELKAKAVALLQDIPGIVRVIDEIQVGKPETFSDYSRDAWITTKLKTALLFDGHVASRNYSIRTVGRVVYLMGMAQNPEELNRVMQHASSTQGVKNVVNYTQQKSQIQPVVITDDTVDEFDKEYTPEMFEG